MSNEINTANAAAIAALAGLKQFKAGKSALEEGTHKVAVTLTIEGEITRKPETTVKVANPAVNKAEILEAVCQELAGRGLDLSEVLTAAVARTETSEFSEAFASEGGDAALHEGLADLMGVPAKVEKVRAGSVVSKGLKIIELQELVEIEEMLPASIAE